MHQELSQTMPAAIIVVDRVRPIRCLDDVLWSDLRRNRLRGSRRVCQRVLHRSRPSPSGVCGNAFVAEFDKNIANQLIW